MVDVDTPFLRPFQVFNLSTGVDDAQCNGTPESGILLQSPNIEDAIQLTINGVDMRLAGTAFLQSASGDALTVRQIDGFSFLDVNMTTYYAVAGSEVTVSIASDTAQTIPFDESAMVGVPVNNLNYRVRIPDPLAQG